MVEGNLLLASACFHNPEIQIIINDVVLLKNLQLSFLRPCEMGSD